MLYQSIFALVFLPLITSIIAAAVQPLGDIMSNETMASAIKAGQVGDLGKWPVPGTQVQLEIFTTSGQRRIPDRYMLMCVIEAQDELLETVAGDPIENGKLEYQFGSVQITLKDEGSPRGRFLNDIAAWTLRGMAEWMDTFEHFTELNVKVYYNQHYCGTTAVKFTTGQRAPANASENTTSISTAPNVASSAAGAVEAA